MLYTLIVMLCLYSGQCEEFVVKDMLPAWECMDTAFELHGAVEGEWYVKRTTCRKMFKTGGVRI